MSNQLRVLMTVSIGFSLVFATSSNSDLSRNLDNEVDGKITYAHLGETDTDNLYNDLIAEDTTPIYLDNNYSSYYFKYLNNNFGNNLYGTCSYTSIGMLLSFYDSYWDDSFIPEQYDVTSEFQSNKQANADFDLMPFGIDSPGIDFETNDIVGGLSIDEYYNAIDQYSNDYFQLKLISLSETYFGSAKFDSSTESLGMTYSEIVGFLNYYLYDFLGKTSDDVAIDSSNGDNISSFTISKIKDGIPVILRAKKSDSTTDSGHAFIAYDYDENSNEIYVHTGWKRESDNTALTHVSLNDLGYDDLWDATAIEPKNDYAYPQNYSSSSGETYCSSNYIFPRDIELIAGNYRDMQPQFEWKSLYSEKWVKNNNPYFNFSILDNNSHSLFEVPNITSKQYTLTKSQWENTLLDTSGNTYYTYLELDSSVYQYWDDYWSKENFTKPKEYAITPYVLPDEYGFVDAYPTDEETKENYVEHTAHNGFIFETRRYRTGYIHDEYIVMSPIREGINEAFIEYRFLTPISRLDVELSYWRTYSSEWLNSSTGTAVLQQSIGNDWTTKLDLLSDSTDLPTDRNSSKIYKIQFDKPAYKIRFYTSTFANNTNDSNRGRICIGDMAFYETEDGLPLSGYELDYDGSLWTSRSYNCYAYSLNTQNHGYMQPGGSDGYHNLDHNYLTKSYLEDMVELDAVNYNFTFDSIGKSEKCSPNSYKVALVIAPGVDYHWYRQNSDGTWSHKLASNPSQNCDASNDLIYDPQYCNSNYSSANYKQFCGFYEVDISQMI